MTFGNDEKGCHCLSSVKTGAEDNSGAFSKTGFVPVK